jgi:hypothetical protein
MIMHEKLTIKAYTPTQYIKIKEIQKAKKGTGA